MCIKNPFDLIKSMTIVKKDSKVKVVKRKVDFYKAKHTYFKGYDNIFEVMKELLTKDEERVN